MYKSTPNLPSAISVITFGSTSSTNHPPSTFSSQMLHTKCFYENVTDTMKLLGKFVCGNTMASSLFLDHTIKFFLLGVWHSYTLNSSEKISLFKHSSSEISFS